MMLLAVMFIVTGLYGLRRSQRLQRPIVALGLAAALLVSSGLAVAAFVNVTVSGDDCNQEFTGFYDLGGQGLELVSECANPIRVTALSGCQLFGTEQSNNIGPCEVGTILQGGESCTLPTCPD